MAEIIIYGPIYDYSAAEAVREMIASTDDDNTLRLNTPGGSVEATWAIISKWSSMSGKKRVAVDGKANSMGSYLLGYAEDVEASDFSTFILHRAGYDSYLEKSAEFMTDDRKASLKGMNVKLRAALESRVDAEKFATVTGVTFDEMFSLDTRIDVELSAKQAKAVGLIDRIVQVTPKKRAEIEALSLQVAAHSTGIPNKQKPTNTKMTLEELRSANPELYAQVIAMGVTQEHDRVSAWVEFNESDPAAVKAGIESGKPITQKEIIALTRAEFAKAQLTIAETGSTVEVATTEATTKTDKNEKDEAAVKAKADFMAEMNASLGITEKTA